MSVVWCAFTSIKGMVRVPRWMLGGSVEAAFVGARSTLKGCGTRFEYVQLVGVFEDL